MSLEDGAASEAGENMSSLAIVNVALRHARLLVLVPLAAMILAGAMAVSAGSSYTAEATFKPESDQLPGGGMAGLAAQFGFDLGSLGPGESLEYYARLVQSREILTEALRSQYPVEGAGPGRTADLLTLYGIEGPTEEQRLWNGVLRLRGDVSVGIDHSAHVLSLQTDAPTPELAVALNSRLLELLSRFNLEKRQSQARAEREFVEEQTRTAAADLEAAEARLAQFLAQNRRYQNSPELVNEAERLRRRVDLRQQVYASLAQSYEQAKLDEVRNTPVFTVLDRPEGSARETSGLIPSLVLGFVLGLVLAGFTVFIREYLASQRRLHPEDYAEFALRTRAFRRRLLPWRAKGGRPPMSGAGTGAAGHEHAPEDEHEHQPEAPRAYHAS